MNSFRAMLVSSVLLAAACGEEECRRTEVCTAIRRCAPALRQLQQAKAAVDAAEKARIISDLRTKVCGLKSDRTVCCEDGVGAAATGKSIESSSGKRKIGSFVNIWHDIGGEVFALDDETILIEDFTYDGQGPDAFFLAGTSGRPSENGQVVLPFPAKEKTFAYTDKDIPILGRFNGDEDVVLKMPPGRKVSDLKWVSVWCRDFVVDFGHVNIDL